MIKPRDLIDKFMYALQNAWGYIWGTAGIMWTEAKQKALEKTTDEERAMGRKYGSKWIGHMVADCSGLFSLAGICTTDQIPCGTSIAPIKAS